MIDMPTFNTAFFKELEAGCPQSCVDIDDFLIEQYGKDITNDEMYPFNYLAKPRNEVEVSNVLRLCNEYEIPVTTRAGGSGLTGGANPLNGGLVLSTENLNRIIEIDKVNKTATVESGVLTQLFCESVEKENLFFPVQPGSSSMSFVGGNVATNCGSISSLKYGSIVDYVLNLEIVLSNGEILWTGANTTKNSTGPNITKLLVGSEGTLGIITKIVFKLIPKPVFSVSLKVSFESTDLCCSAVEELSKSDLMPTAMELVDARAAKMTAEFLALKTPNFPIQMEPHLLVSFDGNNEQNIDEELEKCCEIIEKYSQSDILIAKSHAEKNNLWKVRMNIGEALKSGGKTYRDIDIAVPVSKLQEYLHAVNTVAKTHGIHIFCFGHAGNGNLHTMMSLEKNENQETAINAIYAKGIELGGTISGEHGIGHIQKNFMQEQFSESYLNLLRNIKMVFDPKGIINPGKIY